MGYSSSDIPVLVEGRLAQERLTKLAPRPADRQALATMFDESL